MSSVPAAGARRRRWPRLLALQVALFAGGLAIAEIGWRLVLRARGKPHDRAVATAEIERLFSAARDFVPRLGSGVEAAPVDNPGQGRYAHPFLAWENTGGAGQVEAEAVRLDDRSLAGDVEILTLGGSVADMFGQFGVARLEERLREDPRFASKRIYWYRYARGGFKQPQQLNTLIWLLGQGFTPEAVVAIDGFNEVALAMDNVARGTSPIYPSIPHWGSLAVGGVADRQSLDLAATGRARQRDIEWLAKNALAYGVPWSAIATTLVQRRLNTLRDEARQAYDAYSKSLSNAASALILKGPPFADDPDETVRRSVRMWAECSRSMRAICEARGILYLHVLQPTLHDEGSKPLTPQEIQTGGAADTWIRGVRLGYPRLREAGAQLAKEGERFFDATRVFEGIERALYVDNCHFREDGNRILADAIAERFLAAWPSDR